MQSLTTIEIKDGGGETLKILPMTDHYGLIANGELVAVICRVNELQWGVDVIIGRVTGVDRYIPLAEALKTAMTWRR